MAKHITVRAAQPTDKAIEPTYISINDRFPYAVSDEDITQTRAGFAEDAQKLFDALLSSLPGGTFCQLLVLMLQEKASQFIVSHRKTADYQKMEAANDLFSALEALHAAVKTMPEMNNRRFDQLGIQVNAALAKARGESEGQDG
jgi:hypothetical protein